MQSAIAPVAPPAPTAPVESRPSPRPPASHAFATLLKQSQTTAPVPAKTDPVKPAKHEGGADTDSASAQAVAPRRNAAATADSRRVDDAKSHDRREDAKRADDRPIDGETSKAVAAQDDSSSASGAPGTGVPATHGLVALHRPITAAAESVGTGRAAGAARVAATGVGERADADADGHEPGSLPVPGGAVAARGGVADERKDDPLTLARGTAGRGEKIVAAAADGPSIGKTTPLAPDAQRTESASHAMPSAAPGLTPASLTTSVDASVAPSIASPDFAQAFAVRVTVLVQDGVQSAELHLNPVETGPVSVQIVVDGDQARINFGADALATRQAIEASLPELAGALREAGMTLQGGGVSQHARDPGGESKAAEGSAAARGIVRSEDDARPAPAARQRLVAAGGVDVYA